MAKIKIRHLVTRQGAGGAILRYWQPTAALRREGWEAVRLPNDEGQAFAKAVELNNKLDAWRKGAAAPAPRPPMEGGAPAPRVAPGTLSAVMRAYERSRFFLELGERTKANYRQQMRFLEKWGGDISVASIKPSSVETLYTALYQETPRKAGSIVTMLRRVLWFATKQGLVTTNAASRPGIKGSAPSGRIWPREAVRLFVAAADAAGWHSIGTAVIIGHWTGQRENDILTLPPSSVAGGRLYVKQSKTGARVSIPESAILRDRVVAELARQEERASAMRAKGVAVMPPATLLLNDKTHLPWSEHYFKHVFADVRAALAASHPTILHANGTPVATVDLQMRHLRHTAVTELSVAGCSTAQIAGVTGHSLATVNTILARYLVMTAELADAAVAKRNAYDALRLIQAEGN